MCTYSPALRGQTVANAEQGRTGIEVRPPPINVDYLQYGVSFNGDSSAGAGSICPKNASVPCILGSTGGVTARAGYRSRGPWYAGGAYSFARVDSNSLMRMGVLQQFRGEMRYLFDLGLRTEPYITSGLGAAAFGNEWGVDTVGVSSFAGFGFETQITRTAVVGASLVYRPLLIFAWTDKAGQARDTGIVNYIGFDLLLEVREPISAH